MSAHVRSPSIVPEPRSETVSLVLDDFGRLGRAYVETDQNKADLDSVIHSLLTVQYNAPVRVIAFNLADGWGSWTFRRTLRARC